MKDAAFRAISLIMLLVIPNITSSHQLKDNPHPDEGHWGVVRSGYLSAGKYLALKPDTLGAQMAGMIDGMYLAPMFDAPDEDKYLVRIRVCMTDGDLTNTQIAAIVTKYAKKRPDEWQAGANIVAYQALRDFCPAIQSHERLCAVANLDSATIFLTSSRYGTIQLLSRYRSAFELIPLFRSMRYQDLAITSGLPTIRPETAPCETSEQICIATKIGFQLV